MNGVNNYGELRLSPVWSGRDMTNGRFLKGHVPYTKGKRWCEYMSKRAQRRCAKGWKNLEVHRGKVHPNAGRPKKSVVALDEQGNWAVFPSLKHAAEWCSGKWENIFRCCRQNSLHKENTDHHYKGFRFYFETDDQWICKIKDYG